MLTGSSALAFDHGLEYDVALFDNLYNHSSSPRRLLTLEDFREAIQL